MNAIGLIRQMVTDGQVSQEVAERYFPELKESKESEGEKIRKEIINYLRGRKSNETYGEIVIKYIRWIEWLEKRGEQQDVNIQINPSEYINNMGGNGCYLKNTTQASAWSEEDEYYHNIILYILNNECVGKTDKENAIDWLKSIKERIGSFDDGYKVGFSAAKHNQWKPSEEQMLAINTSINVVGKGTISGKYLIELQEQLKKLREE